VASGAGNKGARSAGVDGQTAYHVERERGEDAFLAELRADLKAQAFAPLPVRERMIPKPGGKQRRLGIPTVRDRVVQAALKLVLEPILEADFQPCSYGFRPGRRAQDAIAEVHLFTSRAYEWVLEGDITACLDELSHVGITGRLRRRIGDRRVLALVKAFLKAGILTEDGAVRDTITGTPQGGILSPLLSNLALSVLDDHYAQAWQAVGATSSARQWHRRKGLATWRLVRYADDFVVLVAGTRAHAEALREEVAAVLAPMGVRLSAAKTRVCHIDEGFDFLGFRIQRHPKRGAGSATSTPTLPRRRWRRSRRSSGRCPARTETSRSPSCCTNSTECCADGPATSSTGCPRRPSTTCAPMSGGGWSAGCAASIPARVGSGCGGATSRGGGRPTGRSRWSTRARWWSPATATGAASPHRGSSSHD
jgi:group II intron reverse transcriptase/maturase